HRIGRTGRAGKVGTSVSFADEDESFIIPDIEQYIGEELKCTNPDDSLLEPLPPPQRRQRHRREESDGEAGANTASEPSPEANGQAVEPSNGQTESAAASESSPEANEQPVEQSNGQTEQADAQAHRRRRHHHRRGRGGKREGQEGGDSAPSAPSMPSKSSAPSTPTPSVSPADMTAAKPRLPRAVIVPKGATEQVWVPGQN
ncbi:MAG: hypothetical protein IJK04_09390, partial [Kiritimatiellae bacterium]|nr:hypothetical protein [Kiritimatiellia bacterium]